MKNLLILAFMLMGFMARSQSDLDISYLGNEGFLIKSNTKKVLIDALFESGYFACPTKEMLQQMATNQPPFNDIDVALITHVHDDHFNAEICMSFMLGQKNTQLIAPEQAVEKMRVLPDFNIVESRIKAIGNDFDKSYSIVKNQVKLEAFCIHHNPYMRNGVNLQGDIRNVSFIVEMEGTRFYHSGDARLEENIATFENHDFKKDPVDLMFLQRYDESDKTKNYIANTIKPDEIIAMHIKTKEISMWRDRFTKHYPYGKIFEEIGEKYIFKNTINFHSLSGEYFGLNKPGNTPEIFALGIMSTKNLEHSYPSFSPDGKEIVWSMVRRPETSNPHVLMYMKEENGHWTWPQIINFSGQYLDDHPVFSPDGQYILFTAKRPVTNEENEELKRLIYYSEKTGDGWGDPILMDSIPNVNNTPQFLIYGTTKIIKKDGQLYRASDIDVDYLKSKGTLNWTFYLSLDGSLALFSSNRMNEKDYGDIYFSNYSNQAWSEPTNLEIVNTSAQERFPGLSNDGEYLFFTRWTRTGDQEIFWITTPPEVKKAINNKN